MCMANLTCMSCGLVERGARAFWNTVLPGLLLRAVADCVPACAGVMGVSPAAAASTSSVSPSNIIEQRHSISSGIYDAA